MLISTPVIRLTQPGQHGFLKSGRSLLSAAPSAGHPAVPPGLLEANWCITGPSQKPDWLSAPAGCVRTACHPFPQDHFCDL